MRDLLKNVQEGWGKMRNGVLIWLHWIYFQVKNSHQIRRESDLVWMLSLVISNTFSLKSIQKTNRIIIICSFNILSKNEINCIIFLDVCIPFIDAKRKFWKYVILAQCNRFFVDAKLPLKFVNLKNNYLKYEIRYVVDHFISSGSGKILERT